MIWENRGREFEVLGEKYKNIKNFYLYGACENAIFVLEQLEYAIESLGLENTIEIYFVDRNESKKEYLGKKVLSLAVFEQNYNANDVVIICVTQKSIDEVWGYLRNIGCEKNINAFETYEFYRYLSLILYYRSNKLYLHLVDLFMNTFCNLNCKECYVQTYRGVRKQALENEIKRNIDLLFAKADSVGIISFGIAEGFMNKRLPYAIKYICDSYANKFNEIHVTTNGTIIPNREFLASLNNPKVKVVVDDYRENVPLARENYSKVIEILKKNEIRFDELRREHWDESGFGKENARSVEQLSNDYSRCVCLAKGFPYVGYSESSDKMYSCVFQTINSYLKLIEEDETDSIGFSHSSALEIIEFLLGYAEKGYLSACKYCNGVFSDVQYNHVPVAIQLEEVRQTDE